MTKLTVAEASKRGYATGLSILQAVQKNWLSAEKGSDGQLMIEIADLERIFGSPIGSPPPARKADDEPASIPAATEDAGETLTTSAEANGAADEINGMTGRITADDPDLREDLEDEPAADLPPDTVAPAMAETDLPAPSPAASNLEPTAPVSAADSQIPVAETPVPGTEDPDMSSSADDHTQLLAEVNHLREALDTEKRRVAALLEVLANRVMPPSDTAPVDEESRHDEAARSNTGDSIATTLAALRAEPSATFDDRPLDTTGHLDLDEAPDPESEDSDKLRFIPASASRAAGSESAATHVAESDDGLPSQEGFDDSIGDDRDADEFTFGSNADEQEVGTGQALQTQHTSEAATEDEVIGEPADGAQTVLPKLVVDDEERVSGVVEEPSLGWPEPASTAESAAADSDVPADNRSVPWLLKRPVDPADLESSHGSTSDNFEQSVSVEAPHEHDLRRDDDELDLNLENAVSDDISVPAFSVDPEARLMAPTRPQIPTMTSEDVPADQPTFFWRLWWLMAVVWVALIGAFFWFIADLPTDLMTLVQWIRGDLSVQTTQFAEASQRLLRTARDTFGPPIVLLAAMLIARALYRSLRS